MALTCTGVLRFWNVFANRMFCPPYIWLSLVDKDLIVNNVRCADAQFHLVLILPVAVAVLSRSLAAVADLIALIVAWKKASRVVRELSLYRVRILLGDVLVRDGELPFFVHEHGD